VTIVVTWAFFVVLSFRNGKTFRERMFALHRQQPDKDEQNVDVAPPGRISADAHVLSSPCILNMKRLVTLIHK